MNKILGICILLSLAVSLHAQYAAFYPTEIYIGLAGLQNQVPGENADEFFPFSSLRLVLNEDLPGPKFMDTKFSFDGGMEKFHHIGRHRGYTPIYVNPKITAHFFPADVVTAGVEFNVNYETLFALDLSHTDSGASGGSLDPFYPDIQQNTNVVESLYDLRGRIIPFVYIAVTPDLLLYSALTTGRSSYSQPVDRGFGAYKNDYTIYKVEAKSIYLTPFNMRFFVSPYIYRNTYTELPARDADGLPDPKNPLLREDGAGAAFGVRSDSYRWGYVELQGEIESNRDRIFGANNYQKIFASIKAENQYFTDLFGYIAGVEYTDFSFDGIVTTTETDDGEDGILADETYRLDLMTIFNLNRVMSIRPQYDMIYKNVTDNETVKHRFWCHFHLLW
ncbi:MAG: hypothetical protein ACQEQ4_04565 [Fibrobacterota bacterium]